MTLLKGKNNVLNYFYPIDAVNGVGEKEIIKIKKLR
jgi:hypothetical protein